MLKRICALVVVGLLGASCGSESESVFPPDIADAGEGSVDFPPAFGEGGLTDGAPPCKGLECQQVACAGGTTTTLTGMVYDPAGKVPLYNVVVYVPNAPVDPIKTGASCDRCGTLSGEPIVSTLTDPAGKFTLKNVPAGKDIPLVIQIGKWRRQLTVPSVGACVETSLTDPQVTRLPRNQAEGDIPQMAIATGNADPFECLLVKMGLDTAEFTPDTGTGRVHYYRENGVDMSPASPVASTLYSDATKMKQYDMIFLPCEGSEHDRPDAVDQNLIDYTTIGGRLFTTHFGYSWLYQGAAPFPATGQWQPGQSDKFSVTLSATINQSFPKGAAFAQWLVNVGASTTLGTMGINEGRHDLNAPNNPPSTAWVTTDQMPAPNNTATMHITFNTPIGVPDDQVCGRVVYSDFHVSASALSGQKTFPASCKTGDLTAQEKALEFMLFDLSSCVQPDKEPPTPPAVVK